MAHESSNLFDMPAPPVMGEWESIAKAYQRELEMLRPIVDAIDAPMRQNRTLYCGVCWGMMPSMGKKEMDGRDGMKGHKEDCSYYLWRSWEKEK